MFESVTCAVYLNYYTLLTTTDYYNLGVLFIGCLRIKKII